MGHPGFSDVAYVGHPQVNSHFRCAGARNAISISAMRRPLIISSLFFLLTFHSFAQQAAAPKPDGVQFQDAVLWLVGGMPSSSLQSLIEERGAQFTAGAATSDPLRLFGANDRLIEAIK